MTLSNLLALAHNVTPGLCMHHIPLEPLPLVVVGNEYSGAPLIWTPLGPSASGLIIEVSSSHGLLIEHGCGLLLKSMM